MQEQAAAPASTFGYGDCITWPFKSAEWIGHVVIQSLIGLIPFVGTMALFGWILTATDNLHEGNAVVPKPGFYLRRGARVYAVAFTWSLIVATLVYGTVFAFFAAAFEPQALGGPGFLFAFGGWFVFIVLVGIGTHVAFVFVVPGAVEADERGSLRGLNPIHAIVDVIQHPRDSLLAALIAYLAWIIAGLGASICYVGILVTLGYGAMVFAGVLYVYERNTKISAPR